MEILSSILIFGALLSKTQIAVVALFEMVGGVILAFGFRWSSVGLVRYGREEYLEHGTINYTSSTRLLIMAPLAGLAVAALLFFRDSGSVLRLSMAPGHGCPTL